MKREEQLVGTNQCWSFTALRQFGDYNPIKIEMMMISSIRNMMMLIIPIKNDDDQLFCGHFSARGGEGQSLFEQCSNVGGDNFYGCSL